MLWNELLLLICPTCCRGLPVAKYSREEVVALYWGFGLWWGKVVSQNAKCEPSPTLFALLNTGILAIDLKLEGFICLLTHVEGSTTT